MFDVGAILGDTQPQLVERLGGHLSGPVLLTGRGEPRSPEYDILDAAPLTTVQRSRLGAALDALLRGCELQLNASAVHPDLVQLIGRIGFLCSSLDLDVDPLRFFRIATFLKLSSGIGLAVDLDDFFLVLRGTGRLYDSKEAATERRLFWSGLLGMPHKGIRTLAVQNLIRSDPFRALQDVEELLDADVNEPLVAFELLRRIGGAQELANMAPFLLEPETAARLGAALDGAGEAEAAAELGRRYPVAAAAPDAIRIEGDAYTSTVATAAVRTRMAMIFSLRAGAATAHRFMNIGAPLLSGRFDRDVSAAVDHIRRLPMFEDVV